MADFRREVHAIVRQLYQHPSKLFPTQQPRSFDRKSFVTLFEDSDKYVVSQKANGLHLSLIFATSEVFGNFCCTMDRSENVHLQAVCAPADLFAGTLVIGEIIGNDFYAFDVVAICGRSLIREYYEKRLESSYWLSGLHEKGDFYFRNHEIVYRTKATYSIPDFLDRFKPISNDDGLIFMPTDKPLTKTLPYKWKDQHTVDLLVRFQRQADGDFSHQIVQPIGIGNITLETENCALFSTFNEFSKSDASIVDFCVVVECLVTGKLTVSPVKFRHDKKSANLAATVIGTIHSAVENITRSEIVEMFLSKRA